MSTQPLEKESSVRKPSSIGEEIRKELEKRGLRAPKSDPVKTNGKEAEASFKDSVETPIQITVVEDSQEDIDIEVKPVAQTDVDEVGEEAEDFSATMDEAVEEGVEAEPAAVQFEAEELLSEEKSAEVEESEPLVMPYVLEETFEEEVSDAATLISAEPDEGSKLEEHEAVEELVNVRWSMANTASTA